MKTKILLVALFGMFIIHSCAVAKKRENILYVKHGVSYGRCNGYCYTEDTYTKEDFVRYQQGGGRSDVKDFPNLFDSTSMKEAEWKDLITEIELKEFYALPEKIGCPGCADGGVEWIEIATSEKTYRVTYESGKPDKELTEMLTKLRKI